jgi:hypothetical protein
MEPELLKYEYVEIYARGTGARNHNTSVVKVDNNILLDHGLYRGLHLIVLSRKNLKKVFNATYDLMLKEKSFPMNRIETIVTSRCQNYTLVTIIKGTEGGAPFNASAVFERLDLGWTVLVYKAEFDKVLSIEKNVTNLRNGTFTQYTTVIPY